MKKLILGLVLMLSFVVMSCEEKQPQSQETEQTDSTQVDVDTLQVDLDSTNTVKVGSN